MAVPGDDFAVACERDCRDHLFEVSDLLAVSPEFGSECAEDLVGLVRNGKLDQGLNDVVVPEGRGSRAGVAAVPVVGIGARKGTRVRRECGTTECVDAEKCLKVV